MTLSNYNLYEIDLGVAGWDALFNTNMQIIDSLMPGRVVNTYGESITVGQAGYIKSDGLIWLAQADGTKQPAYGLAYESGSASDEKRIQTIGRMTNTSWAWNTGQYVYLDPTTAGNLTQPAPGSNVQRIGIAVSATSIDINTI